MHKRKKMIIVGLVYGVIVTLFFIWVYYILINIPPGNAIITPIRDVDRMQRFDRPYSHIEAISSSNITTVEDLFAPKSFNNDNITVSFPEGERFLYHIGLESGGIRNKRLIVYASNGSEISTGTFAGFGSSSFDGKTHQGGYVMGAVEGGGTLTLRFIGTGYIVFLSSSYSDMFDSSLDHSGTVAGGQVAFYLPELLAVDVPEDRRIQAHATSNDRGYYRIRYYDEELRFLGETEGTGTTVTSIPSSSTNSICVVDSEKDVTIRFSYSDPYFGELTPLGWLMIISYMLIMGFGLALIMHKAFSIDKEQRNTNQGGQ